MAARKRPRFEIWEAGAKIHSIDNPVRLKLLRLLEDAPRKLPELVRLTSKAKSTLSEQHLRPLLAAGLVSEEPDPKDSRAKIYRLEGQRLGSSDVDVPRLRSSVLAYANRAGLADPGVLLRVVDASGLVASGARVDYAMGLAKRLGQAVGRPWAGRTADEVLVALNDILREADLGSLRRAGTKVASDARPAPLARFVEELASSALAQAGASQA